MPIFARPWVMVSAAVYFAAVLAVGLWARRRVRNARDFFIAGQSVGLVVTGVATMSAAFSGFVFLGGPGLTYRLGAASLWINAPLGFTAALLGWSLARRLRLLAGTREVFTIPDAVQCRYGSRATAGLAALAVLAGAVGYLGSQLLALGVLVEALFDTRQLLGGWSAAVALGAGLAVLLVYCVAGGMVAGVYTDFLQGLVMLGAAVAVFARALQVAGGPAGIVEAIAGSPLFGPAFLDPLGKVPAVTAFGFFFVFGVGVLGQPHMLHKFFMIDDPRKLRCLPLVLGVSQSVCLLIWVGVGLAVPALVAGGRLAPLARADDAAPVFLLEFGPELLTGLACAGVLAAIMSTASSFLNLGAAALVRDLPRALGRPLRDELRWGRVATVGIGLAAAVVAYLHGDLIALLGTLAFGTFGAALAPALAVGLNWPRVTAAAAAASIAVGMGLALGLEVAARLGRFPFPPFVPGTLPAAVALAASFITLFAVTALTRPRPLPADVAAVLEA
jgi:Na+/proline symporter